METIKNLLSNFLKAQEEKIKLPTFITFLIAFLVFKIWIYWKPISIFLLSTTKIEERIKTIDEEINLIEKNFSTHPFWLAIFFSIIIAGIYTIIFPYIQLHVDKLLSSIKKEHFDIFAELETAKRKRNIKIEKEEQEYRDLQNKNANDKILEEKLRKKDEQILFKDNQILDLLDKISKSQEDFNNQINELDRIHNNEIENIHHNYKKKIEQLNQEKDSLSEEISYIYTKEQDNHHRMEQRYAEQLFDKEEQINDLSRKIEILSNDHNNLIERINEMHSNEILSIHTDYQRKIENLNDVIAELEEKISFIQAQAQTNYNETMHKQNEQLYRVQQEANSENDRLFNENEKLRSELKQLKSKNSS